MVRKSFYYRLVLLLFFCLDTLLEISNLKGHMTNDINQHPIPLLTVKKDYVLYYCCLHKACTIIPYL